MNKISHLCAGVVGACLAFLLNDIVSDTIDILTFILLVPLGLNGYAVIDSWRHET